MFCFVFFCFRHLSSELNEMIKVIGTLMSGEFKRYATADLNRPLLESEEQVLEGVCTFFSNIIVLLGFKGACSGYRFEFVTLRPKNMRDFLLL